MITEPTVRLIGQTTLNTTEFLNGITDHGGADNYQERRMFHGQDADKIAEYAGRTCYQSFEKGRQSKPYHDHIKEVGHFSVYEHNSFTLAISGISRSLTHELIRHRAGCSYSQLSQRFVDESGVDWVIPPLYYLILDEWPEIYDELSWTNNLLASTYQKLVELGDEGILSIYPDLDATTRRKMVREAARCVLPNMTATEIVMSANARAWRHFLHLRGSRHADAEIRRLALAIAKVLKRETAFLFDDIQEVEIANRPGEYELTGTWEKE